jgi:hypothetical protein
MPFILLQSKKSRFAVALGVFFFAWFFLFVLEVFNFDQFEFRERLFRTFVYSLACLLVLSINFFLLQDLVIRRHNFVNIFIWSLWLTFSVGFSNFLITTKVFEQNSFDVDNFLINQSYVFRVFIIIFPLILLINYIRFQGIQLQKMRSDSDRLTYHKGRRTTSKGEIHFRSKYKSTDLIINITEICYISSEGNYIMVHTRDTDKYEQKLIRTTLASIEKQKLHPSLVRCHRGYFVNIEQVVKIKRIDGLDFLMLKECDSMVPLSKNYKSLVKKLLEPTS